MWQIFGTAIEVLRGTTTLAAGVCATTILPTSQPTITATEFVLPVQRSTYKVRDVMSAGIEWIIDSDNCRLAATKMANVRPLVAWWQYLLTTTALDRLPSSALTDLKETRRHRH